MTQPKYNLKEIERRAYRATFQDGLWDIFMGLVFVVFGLIPLLRDIFGLADNGLVIAHITLLVVAGLVLWAGKKFVTMPRIGYVQYSQERRQKLNIVRVVLALSVAFGVIVFIALVGGDLGLMGLSLILAANILIVLGAMAYLMDYDRLIGYAVLWAMSMPIGVVLENNSILSDAPMVFVVTGGIAVIVGLVLFVRFLSEYKLPPKANANGFS
jgi:hypothetical protein